jgi:hypothetical protein
MFFRFLVEASRGSGGSGGGKRPVFRDLKKSDVIRNYYVYDPIVKIISLFPVPCSLE